MAKETFYFSHDYHARSDKKMVRLLAKTGLQGVGIYWCLIEMLYEEGGYLKLNECDCIASELRTKQDKIEAVIHNFDLFKNDGVKFWSESIIDRLQARKDKSIKASESASKKWNNLADENKIKRSERLSLARSKATHNKFQWAEMLEFFNYSCVKCASTEKIVKDHIIPIYQGGSDGIGNIQPLCQRCNCSKGSDNKDYRRVFCDINNIQMPAIFLEMPANACEMPPIKESKVNKSNILIDFEDAFAFMLQTKASRHLSERYRISDLKPKFKEFFDTKSHLIGFTEKSKEEIVSYFTNWLPDNLVSEHNRSARKVPVINPSAQAAN